MKVSTVIVEPYCCDKSFAMRNANFDPLRFVRPLQVSADARRLLIAEAAYFRSQKRGSMPGNATDDWLAAEAEVDACLMYRPLRAG